MHKTSIRLFISWFLYLVTGSLLVAQTPQAIVCSAPILTPAQAKALSQQARLALQLKRASRQSFTTITYVPIRPHIVRRSNGTGGYKLSSMNQIMAATNSHYLQNGVGIQFYFAGTTPDYIDNDYQYAEFSEGEWVAAHDDPRAMNQYYVNKFLDLTYTGYANPPTNDISSTRSFIQTYGEDSDRFDFGNTLVPHELGHNFGLHHTFGLSNGDRPTRELVTRGAGANCQEQADLLCDTPADPWNIPGAKTITVNGCYQYDPTSTARDANGDPYSPSITNIMSYYSSCTYDFTPGQYDQMQAALALRQTATGYSLDYPAADVVPPSNLVVVYNGVSVALNWQDNANNEMGYFIERSTDPATGFVPIGGVAPDITTFTDTKADAKTTYYYRIRPSNTTTGNLSSTVPITTSLQPVTTNLTENSAQLNWNNYGSGVTYDVQWRAVGTSSWNTIAGLTTTNSILYGLIINTTYAWQVKASTDNVYSDPVNFTTLCPIPTYLYSTPNRVSASLIWVGTNAQTYTLQWRPQGTVSWTTVNNLINTAYSLTGLVSATPYEWQVQAICPGSTTVSSGFSSPQSFTTTSCLAPLSPSTVTVRAVSVSLSWRTTADDPGRTFELRYRPVGTTAWSTVSSLTTTTYSLTGLTNNTQYEWQVKSVCSPTESSEYTPLTTFTTFCLSPNGLSSTATNTTISLLWSFSGLPEAGTTYELQYRLVGNSAWTTLTGLITSNYMSRSITDLAPNTTYETRIRSVCAPNAYSDYSATSTVTTGCYGPIGLNTDVITSSSARLSWNLSNDPGTTFDLRYRPVGTTNWNTVSGLSGTTSGGTYTLSGLTNNTPYEWQIRTVCSPTASSDFATGLNFTTQCKIPTNLLASAQVTSVSLTWDQVETGATYDLSYRLSGSANWTTVSNIPNAYATLSVLASNSAYEFQVRSHCSDGSYSDFSVNRSFSTFACSAPFSVYTTSITTTSAQLNWSFSGANADTHYEARYRAIGTTDWITISNLTSSNGNGSYVLTGLSNETQYEWQIKTICSPTESSNFSGSITFQTLSTCTPPINTSATAITTTSAQLNWNFYTADAQTRYEARYRVVGTVNWTTLSNLSSADGYGNFMLTDLSMTTSYEWQIKTVCSPTKSSDFSSSSFFQTLSSCSGMYTIKTGYWNDPTVWSCNRLPISTDAVQIKHVVTVPASYIATVKAIGFDAGQNLNFGYNAQLKLGF